MKNNIKISIIIPVYNSVSTYNTDKYLRQNIESILNQTYNNLEILYINNNCTDASVDIIKKYAEKDSRIIILKESKQGVSNARNCGILHASGEFFTFVDSDDYIDCDYIKSALCKIGNSDILIRDFVCQDNENQFSTLRNYGIEKFGKNIKDVYSYIECSPNIFYKTEFVKKNNIIQDENINVGEDNLFNIQCCFKSDNISIDIDTKGYYYQLLPTSNSNVKSNKYLTFLSAYDQIFSLAIKKYGIINSSALQYLVTKFNDFEKLVISKRLFYKNTIKLLNKYKKFYNIDLSTKILLINYYIEHSVFKFFSIKVADGEYKKHIVFCIFGIKIKIKVRSTHD